MVVPNAPVPVTADMNIKVPVNVKLQPWRYARFFISNIYFSTQPQCCLTF